MAFGWGFNGSPTLLAVQYNDFDQIDQIFSDAVNLLSIDTRWFNCLTNLVIRNRY